jgi:hypothetical protein
MLHGLSITGSDGVGLGGVGERERETERERPYIPVRRQTCQKRPEIFKENPNFKRVLK